MPVKGWSTAKLKAATLKRLDRVKKEIPADEGKRISYDAAIRYLLDFHTHKSS